jgi:hypothetical protein
MYSDDHSAATVESGNSITGDIETQFGERIQTAEEFLRSLYGSCTNEGCLVLWTKQDKHPYWYDLNHQRDATEKAILLSQDFDVYFAIGLQKDPEVNGRGKADTVAVIPGLWLDIDIKGPNHCATDLPPDQNSALALVDSFEVKPTMIVSTGGGYHAYWLFREPLFIKNDRDRTIAKSLSSRFQSAFRKVASKQGWKIDNTSSLASNLRLPGTLNHKQVPPLPVEIREYDGSRRYAPADIEAAIDTLSLSEAIQLEAESGEILEGSRNTTLTSIAGSLRAQGMDFERIHRELTAINESRCAPPLPQEEVESIARSVANYPADESTGDAGQNQSQRIMELFSGLELFRTPDDECYAEISIRGHKEVVQLDSKEFESYLLMSYYDLHRNPPGPQVLNSVLSIVQAKTRHDAPLREVFVRVAPCGGNIYLDLCDDDRQVVEITPHGWSIVSDSPVYFRRAKGMRALSVPVKGGRIRDLEEYINVRKAEQWVLIISWLYYAFHPTGPYPILILHGEQGSAKSTTAKILRDLIDPSSSPLRTLQRNDRELMISARNGWVVAYDNLSGVSKDVSDRLCRLSTGAGFSTRGLYTDSDEVIYNAARPIILNGIDDIANRNDLADRSLLVSLSRITDQQRKTEDDLWKGFEVAKPRILGALLDAVSCGLRSYENTRVESMPRMADFAKRVVAAEQKLPWKPGQFIEIYQSNRDESAMTSFESDVVAMAIKKFIEEERQWQGTTTELKQKLEESHGMAGFINDKFWPKNPSQLSNRIRRISPSLRAAGISVDEKKVRGQKLLAFCLNDKEGVDD